MTWPQNDDTWGPVRGRVEQAYAAIAGAVTRREELRMLVNGPAAERAARGWLGAALDSGRLSFDHCPTNDSWIRDYGALTVRQTSTGQLLSLGFRFNSWGEKYPPWNDDDRVPQHMARTRSQPAYSVGFVLEGGSIDVNGAGLLLTTEQCLLNPNRNPGLGRRDIEEVLRTHLGAEHTLWLPGGIAGDDTDGHVDDLARFVSKRTVLVAVEHRRSDENYAVTKANWKAMELHARDHDLELAELPMPDRIEVAGLRTPASYANFLFVNDAVLLPVFGTPRDEKALAVLARHCPDREVVPVDCRALVYGQGAIHCSSMQEPLHPEDTIPVP
jgi:agmatine deiminase